MRAAASGVRSSLLVDIVSQRQSQPPASCSSASSTAIDGYTLSTSGRSG
jgi:hypothetical protein